MTGHDITDAEYAMALEAGRQVAESEFRAQTVVYRPALDAIEVMTVRNGGFVIPRHLTGALQDVDPDDLGKMELWPDGSVVEIEDLDIHVSIDGMVRTALLLLVPSRVATGLFPASGAGKARPRKKAVTAAPQRRLYGPCRPPRKAMTPPLDSLRGPIPPKSLPSFPRR